MLVGAAPCRTYTSASGGSPRVRLQPSAPEASLACRLLSKLDALERQPMAPIRMQSNDQERQLAHYATTGRGLACTGTKAYTSCRTAQASIELKIGGSRCAGRRPWRFQGQNFPADDRQESIRSVHLEEQRGQAHHGRILGHYMPSLQSEAAVLEKRQLRRAHAPKGASDPGRLARAGKGHTMRRT